MNNPFNLAALFSFLDPATDSTPALPLTGARIDGATPGCYSMDISDEDYHTKFAGASSSALKKMLRSPAHYRAYMSEEDKDSSSRMFGRAVHALLLERARFADKFAVWTGGRRAGKVFDDFAAANPGKTLLTEDEHHRATEAALALRENSQFPLGLWLDGVPATGGYEAVPAASTETSIFWIDEETGLPCKARIDAHNGLPTPAAIDAKTTDDARTNSFMRQLFKLDYDLQAAHYRAALRAFYGTDYPFLFAVVEDQAPYATNIIGLDADVLANGEAKRRHALNLLKKCQDSNEWPSYQLQGIQQISMPFFGRFDPA
jgi:hypothetical protein